MARVRFRFRSMWAAAATSLVLSEMATLFARANTVVPATKRRLHPLLSNLPEMGLEPILEDSTPSPAPTDWVRGWGWWITGTRPTPDLARRPSSDGNTSVNESGQSIVISAPPTSSPTPVALLRSTSSGPSAVPSPGHSAAPSSDHSAAPSYGPSGQSSACRPCIRGQRIGSFRATGNLIEKSSTAPTAGPTLMPSGSPTSGPTESPSIVPTARPTLMPSGSPTSEPTESPSIVPTAGPTLMPSGSPTSDPTASPSAVPTLGPTMRPSDSSSVGPTVSPAVNSVVLGMSSSFVVVPGGADGCCRFDNGGNVKTTPGHVVIGEIKEPWQCEAACSTSLSCWSYEVNTYEGCELHTAPALAVAEHHFCTCKNKASFSDQPSLAAAPTVSTSSSSTKLSLEAIEMVVSTVSSEASSSLPCLPTETGYGAWQIGPMLPEPTAEVAVAMLGDILIVAGGYTCNTFLLDIKSGQWRVGPQRKMHDWNCGDHYGSAVIGTSWFLLGGTGGTKYTTNVVAEFTLANNKWINRKDLQLPIRIASQVVVAIGSMVYQCGGFPLTDKCFSRDFADASVNHWTGLPKLIKKVHHAASGTDGKSIYIFGGKQNYKNSNDCGTDLLQVWKIGDLKWATVKASDGIKRGGWLWIHFPMPQSGLLAGHASAPFFGGEFYVMGGESNNCYNPHKNNRDVIQQVRIYNPDTRVWRSGPDMLVGMHGIYPVVDRSRGIILIAGGAPFSPGYGQKSSTLQVLKLSTIGQCNQYPSWLQDESEGYSDNVYKKDQAVAGTYGGECTCPDGSKYEVGDLNDYCGSLACFGGVVTRGCTPGGIRNKQYQHYKVICAV